MKSSSDEEWVSRARLFRVMERCQKDVKLSVQAIFRDYRKRKKTPDDQRVERRSLPLSLYMKRCLNPFCYTFNLQLLTCWQKDDVCTMRETN